MRPRTLTLAMVLAAALGAGCLTSEQRQQAEDSGSILTIMGPPTPAQAAAMMVDPYNPDKRYKGMTMIANAPWGGEAAYLAIYRDAVQNDTDMGVRSIAARALGFHGAPEDTKLIVPLLKNDDKRVRLEAARALQRLHNPEVIPHILPVMDQTKEFDKDVRQAITSACGQYADQRVLEALVGRLETPKPAPNARPDSPPPARTVVGGALNDDDLSVSRTARLSLRTLTGEDFGDDSKPWLEWIAATPNPFARQTAYIYPTFHRSKYMWEHVPFFGEPPNEIPSAPTGYRPTKG